MMSDNPPTVPEQLLEATPTSLDELFQRDPKDLSDQDIGRIVAELRRARQNWQVTEVQAKSKPKAPAKAKSPSLPKEIGRAHV